jgi:hypothetical protein
MVAIERQSDLDVPGEERIRRAEKHLVRNIIIWTVIAVPVFATVYALIIVLALRGSALSGGSIAMGAGVGILAALFWGLWVGVAATVGEFEAVEHEELPPRP